MDLTRSLGAAVAHVHSYTQALKPEHQGDSVGFSIERTAPHCSVRIELGESSFLNFLRYDSALHVLADVSWSEDGNRFYRVHGVKHESHGDSREFSFPLILARYLLINFYQEAGPIHKCEVRKFQVGFRAQVKLKASSESDRLWTAENLIDRREDYGWASVVREKNEADIITADLNGLFFVSEVQLKSVRDEYNFFPQTFQIQLSEDGGVWQTVQSEDHFFAAPGSWYAWRFPSTRARYVRLQIDRHAHYRKGEYQSKILDLAIIGDTDFSLVGGNSAAATRMASENVPGMVLLAGNNLAAPNRVVQSDDSRLRNASTEYRGIVQFARDNEAAQEKAVQGNDSRLKAATVSSPGIVRLAKDGEVSDQAAVQGSDARLQRATQDAPGIVQLAKDGESRPGVALQGSDSRLKAASTEAAGIVVLAKDGETATGKAVQGNDARLRLSSQTWPGIVQLAGHGEIAGNKAVVADDPRLIEADEAKKGRVQFARKGENADLKAVQASDPRLQNASEENRGVVQFARDGVAVAGQAVQANDSRLSDARPAKPHVHSEYALAQHEYNSHTGNIVVKHAARTAVPDGFSTPLDLHAPIVAENTEGVAGIFSGGIVSSAEGTGAYLVSRSATALQAVSRDQAAASLVSANSFALHIPRSLGGVKGSEKAIRAEGQVLVEGQVNVKGAPCLTVALPKAASEAFVEGDLLTIENGVVAKLRNESQPFIGVVAKEASVQLEGGPVGIRVAVAGLVSLRVFGVVKAGDKLTLNPGQAGTCRIAQAQDRVLAVAVESVNNDREKQVLSIFAQ
ncbi:MAG TPA: discoidin domain-containing protein [Turneriella sp.]|nr:discoidin domain-containing protein [Turneriella sp.]HNE18223.1 discoidin domain-containing protein [Turneriella sp.]